MRVQCARNFNNYIIAHILYVQCTHREINARTPCAQCARRLNYSISARTLYARCARRLDHYTYARISYARCARMLDHFIYARTHYARCTRTAREGLTILLMHALSMRDARALRAHA